MASLTSLSTFERTVMGNKVIVYCDVPGGRSTDDTIDITVTLVSTGAASGAFNMIAIFSMDT